MRDEDTKVALVDRRWNDFHRQLHALASSRALGAYISTIQLAGDVSEVWELIFSPRGRQAAPEKRRLLLRQLAWDVAHAASGARLARALMAMVLWPELDRLFQRFRRRFPHCDLLAKLLIDALGMAACHLRDELDGEDELDVERDILAGTLFVAGKLVGDFELRRTRDEHEADHLVIHEEPADVDTEPDIALPPAAQRDTTVSLRSPRPAEETKGTTSETAPTTTARATATETETSTFRTLPGFFRLAELVRVLDFEHEFRLADAGYDRDGAKLVTVSLRLGSPDLPRR